MTRSRSDLLPQPLPERTTQEIQRARTILAEVRQGLEEQLVRLSDLDASLALVMEGPPPGLGVQLSPQEREVLRLVAEGYTDYAIGQRIGRKDHTAATYMKHIHAKLGTRTRTMAVLKAWQLGLI
jgi:DNA-binding CsgD family transcriptional regulator